jgi:predicted O-methyltransferase YrrM
MASRLFQPFRRRREIAPDIARSRDDSNLDIVLSWALTNSGEGLRFPVAYVDFLRTCLERKTLSLTTVKSLERNIEDECVRRFAALLGALADLPPLEFAVAEGFARIADGHLGDGSPVESGRWAGDVRAHFEMSSSFGHKGRILATIIRFMHSRDCLELGTAYGMSALFMLEALSAQGPDARLTTLEGSELQHRIAARLLENRYPGRVRCECGWTSQVLPGLVQALGGLDFMFHDAGHSRKDYLHDFQAVLPLLRPGSAVLIDDIGWHDPRFAATDPECRKGWLEIAHHARVLWAVEWAIASDQEMGLILLG